MRKLRIINMQDVEVKPVEWLWYPYIPYGKLSIIQGDPGEGKTTIVLYLASLLSKGDKLPCDDTDREAIHIIYQTAEDGLSDTIKPRLIQADADCTHIHVIDEQDAPLTMLDARIEETIAKTGARMMILDPIQAYLGADVNMNVANETRSVMARLGAIAEKHRCAVILIGHMNKGAGKASYRGLGSIDFQAVARSVLVVGRLKDNPQMRILAQGKSSLAPEGDSIAFELGGENGFRCVGKYDITVDEVLGGYSKENKSQMAETLLLEQLEEGKKAQSELIQLAQNQGISKRVMDEAKKKLNIRSVKHHGKWYWMLPQKEGCNIAEV